MTPLKQSEAETQRKTFPKKTLPKNQNGSGNDSTLENVKLLLHFNIIILTFYVVC